MATSIRSTKIYDEHTGTGGGGIDFLIGNVGDKIQTRTIVDISWKSDVAVTITGTTTVTRNDINGSFISDGFRIGDTFETVGAGANDGTTFTITDLTALVITAAGLTNGTFTNAVIHGTTPITALDYNYAISNIPGTITGMVDGNNSQRYNVTGITSSSPATAMNPVGYSKGWEVASPSLFYVEVTGLGTSNYIQSFQIDHYTLIVPLSLDGQEGNFSSEKPPAYFDGDKSLSWKSLVTGKTYNADPASPHFASSITAKGSTGWYNENFNGLPANYSLSSATFVRTSDSAAMAGINSCFDTLVTLVINANAGYFTAGTKGKLFFHWFAEPQTSYQNTANDMVENFRFDSVMLTNGAGGVNGFQYGGDYQAITGATLAVNSSTQLTVTFTASFPNSFFTSAKKYVLGFAVQNPAVTTTRTSDRVSVLCDYGNFVCDLTVSDYFKAIQPMQFYQHPKTVSSGSSNIDGIVGDIWLGRGYFGVKKSASVKINQLEIAVEAVNTNNPLERFDLERKAYDLRKYIPDARYIQDIDITESRNLFTWDIYDEIHIVHRPAMDDTDYAVYELDYPVKLRDEEGRFLQAGAQYFQNPTNNWAQYSDPSIGWEVQLNIYAEVEGEQKQVNMYSNEVLVREYDSPTSYAGYYPSYYEQYGFIITIDTFKPQTQVSRGGIISTTDLTLVKATILGDFTTFPTGMDAHYGELSLASTQTGRIDTCSTELDVRSDSVWVGSDLVTPPNDLQATLTLVSDNEATLECLLDGRKLDPAVNPISYYLTARIGFKHTESLLAQENEGLILQENGFGILIT